MSLYGFDSEYNMVWPICLSFPPSEFHTIQYLVLVLEATVHVIVVTCAWRNYLICMPKGRNHENFVKINCENYNSLVKCMKNSAIISSQFYTFILSSFNHSISKMVILQYFLQYSYILYLIYKKPHANAFCILFCIIFVSCMIFVYNF